MTEKKRIEEEEEERKQKKKEKRLQETSEFLKSLIKKPALSEEQVNDCDCQLNKILFF
jgi:hypothetical protein